VCVCVCGGGGGGEGNKFMRSFRLEFQDIPPELDLPE
jgi:hypothetical protein